MPEPADITTTDESSNVVRTRQFSGCVLCGAKGQRLYEGLGDRFYDTPGHWDLSRCMNPDCGLIWLDPMPLRDEIGKAYRTYYTHSGAPELSPWNKLWMAIENGYLRSRMGYDSGVGPKWHGMLGFLAYLHWFGVNAARAEAVYMSAPKKHSTLLEIGFGDARMLTRLSEFGWNAQGIDSDPAAVDLARAKGLAANTGELSDQGYEGETFDCIVMRHVLEHVSDPVDFVAECFRVLKPGGNLVAIVPNIDSWGHKLFGSSWVHLDPPRHLFMYRPTTLRQVFVNAGFRVDNLFTTLIGAFLVWRVSAEIKSPDHRIHRRLARKLGMLIYQFAACLPMMWNSLCGEELVVIATKPKDEV